MGPRRRHQSSQPGDEVQLGVGSYVVARALVQPVIVAVGVAPVPNPSLLAAVVLPIVLPLLLALAAWSGSRTQAPPQR